MIKQLRAETGAGVTAVKSALEQSDGDTEQAIIFLRQQGVAKAAKRAGKEITNGYIGKYVHNNGRMVVLLEVGCETDFAAKGEDFKEFADKLALHIAANNTEYVTRERVPADIIEKEKAVYAKDVEGKPAEIADKILEGKLNKFYTENVLMDQELFDGDGETVTDAMNELVAKVGEKIEIGRMIKLQLGTAAVIDLNDQEEQS